MSSRLRFVVALVVVSPVIGGVAYAQMTMQPEDGAKDWGWGTSPDAAPIVKPIVVPETSVLPAEEKTAAPVLSSVPKQIEKIPTPTSEPETPAVTKEAPADIQQEMREALQAPAEEEGNAAAFELPKEQADQPANATPTPKANEPMPAPPKEEAAKTETAVPAAEAREQEAKEEAKIPATVIPSALVTVPPDSDPFMGALVATYKTNPRIKAERERQKATDESVAQAVSGFRPTLNANLNKGRQRTSFDGSDWASSSSEDKSLSVEQPLFRGFGTVSGYKSAMQRVKAGAYELSAIEQRVLLQAIAAYMDVVSDASILDLARNNRDVLGKQLEASNERFNVGEVTRTDVAQSEARLSQAKTQVISAEGRLISSIAEFERTVGYKPEGQLANPQAIPELPATLKEALEHARAANPELLSAVHTAKSSEYDVRTRQSTILPRVSLVGSMSRQDGAGVLGSSQFDQDSVTLQVNVPLYQSGAEYSRVREAKNVARQRSEQTIDTRMAVDEAVTKAWEQLETAINTIRTREDQIKAAEIALEGVKQEQEYGARTILDVLDAEQELFNARTNLVAAQRDRVVAAFNLLLNLGRLTPQNLGLPVDQYDPTEHYDDVKWLPFGF